MKSFIVLLLASGLLHGASPTSHSKLWGKEGEAWSPAGRLPDVSHAGYACGEKPIPTPEITANVRDFGAKGDGLADDTAAFLDAIAKTRRGAIFIPAGRYVIRRILEINKPGIVLRGAGPDQTVLLCPVPLNDIAPNWGETTGGRRTSNYSWSGGIVWFKGRTPGKPVARIPVAAERGAHSITLDQNISTIRPGGWIEIRMRDDDAKGLLKHLYSGDPGRLDKIKASSHRTSFVSRIGSVRENTMILDRPLRTDIRPEWNPEVLIYQPDVVASGIEDLTFEFPGRTYGGHFTELGFNAVAFSGTAHCWARNLVITNSDSGIFAAGRFCTLDRIVLNTRGAVANDGCFGHHGFTLSGHDNLLTRFRIDQRFIHDISVERGDGNVASRGSGTDLCLDHHKRAPYENVFTDIDLGAGTRMWKSGGGADLGRECGARGTFWNIRAAKPQQHPGAFGPPSINLVAVTSSSATVTENDGIWFENIDPSRIDPPDIHEAQLKRRLQSR